MRIFLCASMNFYRELVHIEGQLTGLGHQVSIPVSAAEMKLTGDYDATHYKGSHTYPERAAKIRRNFEMIEDVDAILVINNEKNGIKGYIGANVQMEIALAFYFNKKIFIWNPIEPDAPYLEEMRCFGVEEINQDLGKIHV